MKMLDCTHILSLDEKQRVQVKTFVLTSIYGIQYCVYYWHNGQNLEKKIRCPISQKDWDDLKKDNQEILCRTIERLYSSLPKPINGEDRRTQETQARIHEALAKHFWGIFFYTGEKPWNELTNKEMLAYRSFYPMG